MRLPRIAFGLAASLATAAGAVLAASPAASAYASPAHALSTAPGALTLFQGGGLTVQESNGYYAASGPAAYVKQAAATLTAQGVGNTALYTGPGGAGGGIVILTGNDQPEGTDFQVMKMTAVHVENNSTHQDAVYSDDSSALDALVAPGQSVDVPPVDVDFAVYPVGATPPPDNRGLNPNAQFTWDATLG